MQHNLTAQFVESTKAPRNGKDRETFWDEKTTGFGLRVTAKGARTWVAMYRHGGRQRWLTLGTYPVMPLADARQKAKDALNAVQHGADPAGEKKIDRAADTWASLCERYLAEVARKDCKPKTLYEYERIINNVLLPKWRNLKAKDVTRAEVKALIGPIRARGAEIEANRVAAMISIIGNFGLEEEILESNPATRIKKTKEQSRDRVLSADEIRAVWKAFDEPALKLLLLTGQRSNEVAEMTWSEVDLEAGIWTIAAERSKNRLSHRVPLVGEAARILRGLPREGERVFQHGLRGSFEDARDGSGVAHFTPHDLRRTVGTGLAELGIDRTVIKKVLNHSESKNKDVTTIYDRHGYDNEKRDALTRWDERIKRILNGEWAIVIEMPSVKAQTA
jgi:integrase